MPKILNLTIEEKAERYSKLRKGAVHLTIEERADKWDELRRKDILKCLDYASRNKEKLSVYSNEHYVKNKLQYDANRMKKYYDAKNPTELQKSNKID